MPAWLVEWFSAGPEAWPTLPARPKDSLPPRGRFGLRGRKCGCRIRTRRVLSPLRGQSPDAIGARDGPWARGGEKPELNRWIERRRRWRDATRSLEAGVEFVDKIGSVPLQRKRQHESVQFLTNPLRVSV